MKTTPVSITRCENFAEALDNAPDATGPEDTDVVLALIDQFGLTVSDFWELDERPGQFWVNGRSYTSNGSKWHSRLRRTRNGRDELFDKLAK